MNEIYILGTKITDISLNNTTNQIADFLLTGEKGYITTPNPEICLLGLKNKPYRRIFNKALLSIPDGVGLKLGGKIIRSNLVNTTKGVDLCQNIIKLAEQNLYSILILGGKQETGKRALNVLSEKYPNLHINYINGGTFDSAGNSDQSNLITTINQLKPDIILVCLGAPKQEWFMSNNLEKIDTKLMLGVGGTIDFLAGQIKRAPLSWQNLGLEWLWRLIQEPWRWKRILNAVIIFPLTCIISKFKHYD